MARGATAHTDGWRIYAPA